MLDTETNICLRFSNSSWAFRDFADDTQGILELVFEVHTGKWASTLTGLPKPKAV